MPTPTTRKTRRLAYTAVFLFGFLLILVSQASAAPPQQITGIAATSFENETAAVTNYTDTGDPAVDHALANNAGQPIVNSTSGSSGAGDLGFTATYFSTQGAAAPGLTDGDLIGVTSNTTDVGSYDNGSKGYRLNDTDGRVDVRFDPVTYDPSELGREVSVAVYIPSTGSTWDIYSDKLSIYIEDGSANIVPLDGAYNAGGFIDIDNLTTNTWFDATLNISEAISSGALTGDTFTLVFSLESNADNETVYIDDVVFASTVDTTPPTVVSRDPNHLDNGVSIATTIDITFNEFVQKANTGVIQIIDTNNGNTVFESYDLSTTDTQRIGVTGDTVTINPVSDFTELTTYSVVIPSGAIEDMQGNDFAGYGLGEYSFTTADATAPALVSLNPADDATNVSPDISGAQNLTVSFNEQVNAGAGNVSIYKSDDTLVETIDITNAGRVSFFLNSPTEGGFHVDLQAVLEDNTSYYVQIDAGAVVDNALNAYAGITDTTSWNFTTGDFTAPSYTTLDPADDATNVSLIPTLNITFDETVQVGTGNITIHETVGDAQVASFDVTTDISLGADTVTNDTVSFTVGSTLNEETEYYVLIPSTAITDMASNAFAGISSTTEWSFTTGDFTAPTISTLDPADDETNVDPSTNLQIVFSEDIAKGTGTIEIRQASDDALFVTVNAASGFVSLGTTTVTNDTATINPNYDLEDSTEYYVVIPNTAFTDTSTNANQVAGFAANEWNFTTGDYTEPQIVTLTPPDNDNNVDPATNFTIQFNENVQAGTGNITLYSGSQVQAFIETFDDTTQFTGGEHFSSNGGGVYYGINDGAGGGDYGSYDNGVDPVVDPATPPLSPLPYVGFDGSYLEASASSAATGFSAGGTQDPQQLVWTGIDITNLTNLSFQGDFASVDDDTDGPDFMRVEVQIDGGGYVELIEFRGGNDEVAREEGGSGILGQTAQTFHRAIAGTGNTLDIRFTLDTSAANDDFAVDNFIISGISNTPTLVEQVAIGDTEVTIVGDTVTYNPTATLNELVEYFIIVDAGAIVDTSANINIFDDLTSSSAWNFATGEFTAPTLVSLNPADDSTGVSTTPTLSIILNENIQAGTGNITIHRAGDNGVAATFDVTTDVIFTNDTAEFTVSTALADNTAYYVSIPNGAITDMNGNAYAGFTDNATWSFTTGDYTGPSVVILTPLDDATNVALDQNLIIEFNENVAAGTGNITIFTAVDDQQVEQIAIGAANVTIVNDTVTVNPTADLVDLTEYYVILDAGAVTDASPNTNAFSGITTVGDWSFTTGDFTGPNVVTLTPPDDATNVDPTTNLVIQFDENMAAGTGNIRLFRGTPQELFNDPLDDASQLTVTTGNFGVNLDFGPPYTHFGVNDGAGGGDYGDDTPSDRVTYNGFDGGYLEAYGLASLTNPSVVEWQNIDITGATNLQFSADFASALRPDLLDSVTIEAIIDGGTPEQILLFNSSTNNGVFRLAGTAIELTDTAQNFQVPITGTGRSLTIRTILSLSASTSTGDDIAIDNVIVTGSGVGTSTLVEQVTASDGNVSIVNNVLTFDPTSDLDDLTDYYVTVDAGAVTDATANTNDFAGILDFEWNFITGDYTGLSLVALTPPDESTDVALDQNLIIEFDENVAAGTGNITIFEFGATTELFNEPFDNSTGFATSTPFFSDEAVSSGFDYFGISDGAGGGDFGGGDPAQTNSDVYPGLIGNFLTGQDLDGEGASLPITIEWTGINITGETGLQFSGDFAEIESSNIDQSDFILVEYQIDGGGYQNLLAFRGYDFGGGDEFNGFFYEDTDFNGVADGIQLTTAAQTFVKSIAGTGSTLDLRLSVSVNAGDEDFGIDDFIVTSSAAVQFEQVAIGAGNVTILNDTVTVDLATDFADLTEYYVIVDAGAVTDDSGNANDFAGILNAGDWSFTTGDFTAPQVLVFDPEDNSINVPTDTDLNLEFDEEIQTGSGTVTIFDASDDSVVETITVPSAQVGTAGSLVGINPVANLSQSTSYYVQISAGAFTDVATTPNDFAGILDNATWNFTITPLIIGGVCTDPATLIGLIQGNGSSSPFVGDVATIEGIVVGDYQDGAGTDGELDGFFVQDAGDADATTSDGIFIYEDGVTLLDVNPGDVVRVTGTIDEGFSQTQLELATEVALCGTGSLPSATQISLPLTSGDDFEQFEGMYVEFPQALVVTELFQLGRFGELRMAFDGTGPDGRLGQFTQQNAPDAPGYAAALADNARRSFIFDDGFGDQNPFPLRYPAGFLAADPVRGGDSLTGAAGVLNYSFSEYRLQPVASETYTFAEDNPRPTGVPNVDGAGTANITVVAANVLNFFETIDTINDSQSSNNPADDICGPLANLDCRGADGADQSDTTELIRQRDKIVAGLTELDADIFGLIEIENDGDDTVLDNLVGAMNDATAPNTYDYIKTGGIGTDAIRVALVYKPAVVSPDGAFAVLDNSVDPTYRDDLNRPTLAQTFEVIDGTNPDFGAKFTVAVVHFKSKGSDCDGISDPDLNDGQGNCNLTRLGAATAVVNWLATDPTSSGDPDYMVIGDFNAYFNEDPMTYLATNGYNNLFDASSYSYVFDGQWGSLDHAVANSSMAAQVTAAEKWHVNADEPSVLDYDINFNDPSYYAADEFRFSDHDPLLIGLDLANEPQEFFVYLPVILNAPRPDLIVEDVTVTSTDITVVIRNVGSAPVTGGFYVDAYIGLLDPNTPPTGVNDIWQSFSSQGVVWGVNDDPSLLTPGNSMTLTLNDSYQLDTYTDFTLPWASGTAVYVQVDSASAGNTDGGITELDEVNGGPYNNILGPVFVP